MYKHLSVLKLNILEDGEVDASGKKCIFKKDTIIDGNLILKGTINGIAPVPPENQIPVDLLGFWPRNLGDYHNNDGSNFGNYSNVTGTRTLLQFPHVPNETLHDLSIQFNNGRRPRTVVFFADNTNFTNYIATTELDEGLITYLGPINRDSSTHGIVFDPLVDRYLALRGDDGAIITYNPSTGVDAVLTTALPTAANISGNKFDSIIIGDTVFFSCFENTFTEAVDTEPIFVTYNRITGALQSPGNVAWTGDFIYTGTIFKNTSNTNLRILSMAYEPKNFKVYFLIGYDGIRFIGYYQSDSSIDLRTELLSGNFDITLLEKNPNDFLHAIVWIGGLD